MPTAYQHITIVLDSLEIGGAERQAFLLADELQQRGRVVNIIGLTTSGKGAAQLDELEIPYQNLNLTYSYGKLATLKNIVKLRKAIRKTNAEVVLPYTYWPNVLAGNAAPHAGVSKCFWNQRDEGLHMFGTYFERRAINKADAIVSNSPSGKDALAEKLSIAPDKIHIIPNGIRLAPFQKHWKDWRTQLNLDEDRLSAVMIANLHAKKDHHTMLLAWKEVVRAMPTEKPVLILAGRFSGNQDKIRAQAEELGIANEVFLLGGVDDIRGLLDANDILVHSSRSEGCPNAVLEAMSVSMGVVATDIPGIRMALGDDCKWLAPVGDPAAFAKKVVQLLNNTGARRDAGNRNKARIQEGFTPRKMVEQYLNLIDQ